MKGFFARQFNLPFVVGALVVVCLFSLVLFGPVWAPTNPYVAAQHVVPHYDVRSKEYISPPLAPSAQYPLGTDRWGNDLLSMLMHGARNTLVACAFITMSRVGLGLFLGGLAGWNEGQTSDRAIMGAIGVITAMPTLISSIIVIYALDIRRGLPVFIVALSAVGWTEIAQYVRSEFLVLRRAPFVEGARAVGLNGLAIAVRHLLPNVLPQLLVFTCLEMGAVMMLLGELGFVGVYIGGGSRIAIETDPRTFEYYTLVEVPEWGAMLADGFRWLRTRPFVVWPPALAFFVSVVGFNALGEGLRQQIDRRGVSTAFLLRGRVPFLRFLLAVGALSLATVFIIRNTGPAPWFARVAQSFDGERAYKHVEALLGLDGRGAGQDGGIKAADYIASRFQEYGLEPGAAGSSYVYPLKTRMARPRVQPYLALLGGPGGQPLREFRHQIDFGFVTRGHGGSGDVQAPVTLVGFEGGADEYAWSTFKGLDLRDRIVLLSKSSAPPDFDNEALIRGARGVLWVAGEEGCGYSQVQLFGAESLRRPNIPIFCIRPLTAQALLEAAGCTIEDLSLDSLAGDDLPSQKSFGPGGQMGPGWYAFDLGISVHMSLALDEPHDVEIPCVVGYKPGSDHDLAGQLVVLFASYDGLGRDPDGTVYPFAERGASGVSILLELARLWQEQKLDARRPVLFVAWGGSLLEDAGAERYLRAKASFRHLPSVAPLAPVALFQVGDVGGGSGDLSIHPDSSKRLIELIQDTSTQLGVPVRVGAREDQAWSQTRRLRIAGTNIPQIYLSQTNVQTVLDEQGADPIRADRLQGAGETLALALTRVLRQTSY